MLTVKTPALLAENSKRFFSDELMLSQIFCWFSLQMCLTVLSWFSGKLQVSFTLSPIIADALLDVGK